MSILKVLAGLQHKIPETREFDWGEDVTELLVRLCDYLEGVLTLFKLTVKRIAAPFQSIIATSGSTALDFALGYNLRITLQASTTFSFSNPRDGERYLFKLMQDAVGGRTVTWPAAVQWAGAAPVLSTAANKYDLVALLYDASLAKYSGEFRLGYG